MAGHSKWANIKRKKAVVDAQRGKIFTKCIREITIAARLGGGDVQNNPRLRSAVQAALAENMTKDTIERAIKRGVGDSDQSQVEEIRYEGYGPNGVAVMVDCLSDNRNRTVGEVRHAFTKCGGNLGTTGSVNYLFNHQGVISFAPGMDENAIMEAAIEAGALDVVQNDDGSLDVVTTPEGFGAVCDALEAKMLKSIAAEITMVATTQVPLTDLEAAESVLKLIDMLEDLDDVQKVYTNANISADVMEKL